jgi:hypothetical protein
MTFRGGGTFQGVSRFVLPDGSAAVSVSRVGDGRAVAGTGMSAADVQWRPLDQETARAIHQQHARLLWIWFFRESPRGPVTVAMELASPASSLTLRATGPDEFNLALQLDETSCLPVSATWARSANFGDALAGRAPTSEDGMYHVAVDLRNHEDFGGIRVPTRMRWSSDGVPTHEWRVIDVEHSPASLDDILLVKP